MDYVAIEIEKSRRWDVAQIRHFEIGVLIRAERHRRGLGQKNVGVALGYRGEAIQIAEAGWLGILSSKTLKKRQADICSRLIALTAEEDARCRMITFTEEEWHVILDRHFGRCHYCGKASEKLAQDHKIPRSKGGANIADNIVPACKSCNSSKGVRDYKKFVNDSAERLQLKLLPE